MGIRTRGVSLSLESLGIAIPRSNSNLSRQNRSLSNSSNTPNATSDSQPNKRLKRSHTSSSSSSASPIPLRPASSVTGRSETPASKNNTITITTKPATETTPPPSPGNLNIPKLDTQGINDDIVVAVLEQLQSTGNRPHLIKELATILSSRLKIVESSSNPQAIISSRLTNYLRRPWSAIAPCPLAKEQVVVHPRRVYFFLTTCPRQQIPEFADVQPAGVGQRVISPSASSGPEDEMDISPQEELIVPQRSPSPDLDLSLHGVDIGQPEQPDNEDYRASRMRTQSPPLEHDEREFSQAVSSMQARKQSDQLQASAGVTEDSFPSSGMHGDSDFFSYTYSMDNETADHNVHRHHDNDAALFGGAHAHLLSAPHLDGTIFSSPLMRPMNSPVIKAKDAAGLSVNTPTRKAFDLNWGDMRSPEAVGLHELDKMLGDF